MVCHVDFSVEAIQLSTPSLSDSAIDKEAHGGWERDHTNAVKSSLSLSTSCEVCRQVSALFIVRFYQVPLRV